MSSLFLLDRGTHSVGFSTRPDPSSTIWFDFEMLQLPMRKFGCVGQIPADELHYYIKKEVSQAERAVFENQPDILISSGRACLVHMELINLKVWKGKNVFVDFPVERCEIPEKTLKNETFFLSSTCEDNVFTKLRDFKIKSSKTNSETVPIDSRKIDTHVQQHFF